ncbi:MAG: Bax inhibitor-1/YccA family protein [Pseudomonadota bacterium]
MVDYQPTVARAGARPAVDEGLRAYMNKVYMHMASAMVVTGLVAFAFGTNANLLAIVYGTPLKWVAMFAPLGFALFFGAMVHRMSASMATILFYAFSVLMGISISYIFARYTGMSIFTTFFATAVAFLGLSLYGYTTKSDLSGIGRFCVMGLIGVIVVSLLNFFFIQSSPLHYAISAIGVLVIAGLTAYDTQQIKNNYLMMAQAGADGVAYLQKGAIIGAFSLYLNFINMFLMLLQFMGASNE